MASGVAVTGNFTKQFDKNYKKMFFDEYVRQPEQFSKIAKIETGDTNFIKEARALGISTLTEKKEGMPISFENPTEGSDKTIYFTTFAKGFQVTREMIDDELYGIIKKMPQQLAKAAAYTKELKFWDLFNSAFTGGKTGVDGSYLCVSNHPLYDVASSTYSNLATGSLSMTTLQSAITKFDKMVNDKNIPIISKPNLLIIPPELRFVAKELLLSEYNPENANNAINSVKDEGLQFMVSNYLTSTSAWFLVSKQEHDLRFVWRNKLAFEEGDDFHTGNKLYKATMRFTTDFFDWRGVVGSTGS